MKPRSIMLSLLAVPLGLLLTALPMMAHHSLL